MLGKHFYDLFTREEGHAFTLSVHLVELCAEPHSTRAHGVSLAERSEYIIPYEIFHHLSFLAARIVVYHKSLQKAALQKGTLGQRGGKAYTLFFPYASI